jgi:cell division protein FtsB
MIWMRILVPIVAVAGLAFLMGKTQNSKRRAVHISIFIGSLLLLLTLRFGFTRTWEFSLFLLALALNVLDHIPLWFVIVAMLAGASYFIALRLANSTVELARELEQTKERMTILEKSIRRKPDDIASRLPEQEEPDYLTELSNEGMLD